MGESKPAITSEHDIDGFDTCTPRHLRPGQVCVLVQVYGLENHQPYSTTEELLL